MHMQGAGIFGLDQTFGRSTLTVIPANAGIQVLNLLDTRLRGYDKNEDRAEFAHLAKTMIKAGFSDRAALGTYQKNVKNMAEAVRI